jgi:UDP-N-acetylglucosamine--N-acetylmuramyl-(pentapeptide) pyrophosphoryl-undecaprenol N-acetylglucosamine transferase
MISSKKIKIVITGGGTGGHIFPLVAFVRFARKFFEELNFVPVFYYLGPVNEFVKKAFQREGVKIFSVFSGKIRRYITFSSVFLNFLDFFKILFGFFQSLFLLFFIWPKFIFSKGGFGSFPVCLAGKIFGRKIFLHESDFVLGLANKILAKFSKIVFVSFKETEVIPPTKKVFVGNIVRKEILEGDKERAKKKFSLIGDKKIILILGGSQGAQRINERIFESINLFLENFELIHQVGPKNIAQAKTLAEFLIKPELKKYYHPFGFLEEEDLADALSVSDLVISRAGAGAIFEIALVGKPSILIPLKESAQNHQLHNAYAFARSGACIVIEEENFTSRFLFEIVESLFSDEKKLKEMENCAKNFAPKNTLELILKEIFRLI